MVIMLNVVYANTPKSCEVSQKPDPISYGIAFMDTNKTIKACTKAIKDYPNEVQYWYDLGSAYESSKNLKEAFHWWSRASAKGHADAQYQIADMYYDGRGIKEDKDKAIALFKKLANKGNTFAQRHLGRLYINGDKPLKQNYKEAMSWYMKSAENNDTWAQYSVGEMYQLGQGMKKDIKSAIFWYTKSADLNNSSSQIHLGDLYYEGKDVKQNYNKALNWYIKAAENKNAWFYKNGNARAQIKIADMYYDGVGVKKDYKKAFKWFMKAAKQNVAYAQFSIGWMYASGEWATRNFKKSFKWYLRAAEQGHAVAQFSIAKMYDFGIGTKVDKSKSFYWFKKVAEQGHAEAQFFLATAYHEGNGIRKNYTEAFKWFLKSAMQGYATSLANVALLYRKGEGVKKNYIKAYAWYSTALTKYSSQDSNYAEVYQRLENLEKLMTPEQIALAQAYNPLKKTKQLDSNSKINKSKAEQSFTGTGFFVDKSTVLTNSHVVKNCNRIELIRQGYTSTAKIKSKDSLNDLAILKADTTNSSALNFRAGKGIRIGDDIIVIGYPLGELLGSGIKLTTGNVSALTGLINDTTSMQLTAPVQPGNSGGALLDTSGNVVGVVVARLKKEQNVNLAIKANVAQMFLDINNVDYSVAISKDKKDVADIADEAKESIVQVVCYQ